VANEVRRIRKRFGMNTLSGSGMTVSDNYLFSDVLMDQRFRITTEILEQFVSNPSQDLSTARLVEHTGHTAREVNQVCRKLQLAGLVKPSKPSSKAWMLICDPSTITLEDVYRGVIAEKVALQEQEQAQEHEFAADADRSRSVDLLIMQATMEVNQSILKHLRQFSLGRPRNTHFSSSRR
jgi:DNA-binding IscR family transcriptional regulator